MTVRLSEKQRLGLEAVRSSVQPFDGIALARRLDTSPEGAHQTMASLVRRGLVRKGRVRGAVRYEAVPE